MAFKLPFLKGKCNSDGSLDCHGLPLFEWKQLRDKEEAIGRGSYGLVFVARNNSEKVVIKKLLGEDEKEKRLFLKEAKILHGIKSEHIVRFQAVCMEPCAIMLEYLFFDFAPFGSSEIVSSLDRLLQYIHINEAIEQFPLQEKIALETAIGLAHLHDLGIVHRDIKPANILVSNQHYCTLKDSHEIEKAFQTRPIICKLADFGESRSVINQTNNVCRMVTNNLARGTPAYRAPEIFCQNGSALSLVDLKAVDIWALGMVLFVIINPDLKYPFQMELERVQTGNCLSVLEGLISKNEKPAHSDHYCMQHAVNCLRLRKLSEYCTRFHPKDRPDAKYIVDVLKNEDLSNSRNLPLTVNQGTCIENATSSYVPSDGTNGCAFLSVVFGDHLLCQNERSTVTTFEEIACLAEEVIIDSPLQFNPFRDKSRHYDVSEAYGILKKCKVIKEEYEFSEEILSSHGVYSVCARDELRAVVYQLTAKREMRLAFYSCGGYIFTIGWAFGYLFIMDTHAIFHELGGNGNGLVKVFLQDDRQLAAEDLCAWVWKRLSQSGVKSCAQQSVAEMTKSSPFCSHKTTLSEDIKVPSSVDDDLKEEAYCVQGNDSSQSPSKSPVKKKVKRYQTAIKVEQEFGKRKLNLDLSSQSSKVPDVISIDSSEDENQHDASVLSDNDANSTSIKASEEVTVDNSKDDGVVEYQSCASISSDIDGDRVESDDDDSETFVNSSESQDHSETASFYLGDKHIPVYASEMKELSNSDIARLLLDPPEDKVASKPPVKCQENKIFIIDKKSPYFRNPDDWKADGLGVYKNDGTHVVAYYEDKNPEIRWISKTKPEDCKRSTVLLKRTYWTHVQHPDFRRRAYEILRYSGHSFTPERFVLLQYSFSGKPHAITTKPHGNSKSEKAFTRTKPGVLESIKGKVKGSAPPSKVYDEVFEEAGGLLKVCSVSDVPRNRKQVENAKYKGREVRSQDELYDLTLKSKEEEETGKVYIRRLQVAPSPACVLASDRQVQDVKRFCANTTEQFSVLSIDTTFNIGDFYVTPTTYRHLLLDDRRTENPPLLLGPTLIHTRKDSDTFSYFGATLTGLENGTRNIRFIGSDREDAVEKGMSPYLPVATWLACKRHVVEDCKRKLRSLGISSEYLTAFLRDIFGSDANHEKGLIDSEGCMDFDAKLESLENVWNSREKTSRGTALSDSSEAEFHKYFVAHVAEDMKKKMISPVRKRAGLGEAFFYNNAAESKHQRIKARKGQMYGERKLAWTEVVDLLKSISEEEERNCERAIVDEGPFKIRQQYSSKLHVPFSTYIGKSHAQKEKVNRRVHEISMEAFLQLEEGSINNAKAKNKNLTKCAYKNMPKSVGGKPGEAERKRKRNPQSERSTSKYTERVPTPPKPTLNTNTFKVKWLKNSRVYRCYGCRQNIRPKPQKGETEVVPPPPWDLVLARLELRLISNGAGELKMSIKPEPVHYHPKLSCIRNAHGKKYYPSVEVTDADKELMDDIHLRHLRSEFGV